MDETKEATVPETTAARSGLPGLDAYRVAVEFYRHLRQGTRGRRGHVVEQLLRAAESIVLNVAEAYWRSAPIGRAGFASPPTRPPSATPPWT